MPTAKDYPRKIEGTAWDLFHLWDMPTEMAIFSHNSTIFVQSLATGNKALANLIDVDPINQIFMFEDEVIAKYRYNIDFLLMIKKS